MLPLLLYLIFLAATALLLSVRREAMDGREEAILRATLAAVSLCFGALGLIAGVDLIRDTAAAEESILAELLVFGSLAVGGGAFALGVVVWAGAIGLALRVVGWILIVLPLAVPSTLTLGLPFASVLVVATRRFELADHGRRPPGAASGRAAAKR